jgi:hypothetical protein
VLKSNIAACHLKLEDWKEAIKAATAALDGLDRLQGRTGDGKDKGKDGASVEEEADEEIISAGAAKAEDTSDPGKREADIERIRAKALLRRARARSEQGGWASLQGAEEGTSLPFHVVGSWLIQFKTTRHYHRCRIYLLQIKNLSSDSWRCFHRGSKRLRRRRWER